MREGEKTNLFSFCLNRTPRRRSTSPATTGMWLSRLIYLTFFFACLKELGVLVVEIACITKAFWNAASPRLRPSRLHERLWSAAKFPYWYR